MGFSVELLLFFFIGLFFGSFGSVLIHRIPREIPLGLCSHRRSVCPHCQSQIEVWNNIPLFAYIRLRGKCAHCGKQISKMYPLTELVTGLLFAGSYFVLVRGGHLPLEGFGYWGEIVKTLYFVLSLIVVTAIDLEFRIIPDRFSLGNWVLSLAAAGLWQSPSLIEAAAGGLFGFGAFFLMAWGYEKLKGVEGLGFGDVKMMGWLGSWVGLFGVPFVILLASVSGLAVGLLAMRRSKDGFQTAIPFGPFLAVGAYVVWVLQSFDIL